MDNLIKLYRDPALKEGGTETAGGVSGAAEAAGATAGAGQSWKSGLRTDLRDSPFSQKFEDTPEGLNKAMESYGNLEKLLGHEKVPIPKDANDVEGWNRFSKAMGIPDAPEGYGLEDGALPESMKGMTMDKAQFAKFMHENKVHPNAVKGLWKTYQEQNVQAYQQAMNKNQEQLTKTVNALKSEWGDSYQVNVELGQMVINKFSADKETNDFMTALLASDPRGIKFLAKIGEQFAENKVSEFQMKRFSVSPAEAMEEVTKMKQDLTGPYWNQKKLFTPKEQEAAISRVNSLLAIANKKG